MYGMYGYGYGYGLDPTIILVLIGVALSLWAQGRVNSTFSRYSRVRSMTGMTGAEAARRLLNAQGIYDVTVQQIAGSFLRLSITISQAIPGIHIGSVKPKPHYLASFTKIFLHFRHFYHTIFSPMPVKALFISIFRCQKRQDMPRTSCLSPVLPRLHRPQKFLHRNHSGAHKIRQLFPHGPHPLCLHHIILDLPLRPVFRSHLLQFPVHHKYLMNRSSSFVSCIPTEFTSASAPCAPDLSSKQLLLLIRKFHRLRTMRTYLSHQSLCRHAA